MPPEQSLPDPPSSPEPSVTEPAPPPESPAPQPVDTPASTPPPEKSEPAKPDHRQPNKNGSRRARDCRYSQTSIQRHRHLHPIYSGDCDFNQLCHFLFTESN